MTFAVLECEYYAVTVRITSACEVAYRKRKLFFVYAIIRRFVGNGFHLPFENPRVSTIVYFAAADRSATKLGKVSLQRIHQSASESPPSPRLFLRHILLQIDPSPVDLRLLDGIPIPNFEDCLLIAVYFYAAIGNLLNKWK